MGAAENESEKRWLSSAYSASKVSYIDRERGLFDKFPYFSVVESGQYAYYNSTSWHMSELDDGEGSFGESDTSLAHMLSERSKCLEGLTYGERLARSLIKRGMLDVLDLVEVGCGLGHLAKSITDFLDRHGLSDFRYRLIDVSPELQGHQRDLLAHKDRPERFGFFMCDASDQLPFAESELHGLVIQNEVCADLDAVRLRANSAPFDYEEFCGGIDTILHEEVRRATLRAARDIDIYDLARHIPTVDDGYDDYWLNIGAIKYLEELNRILAPGGRAVVIEYVKGQDQRTQYVKQLDHDEFAPDFNILERVARRLSFVNVQRVSLSHFFECPQLWSTKYLAYLMFNAIEVFMEKQTEVVCGMRGFGLGRVWNWLLSEDFLVKDQDGSVRSRLRFPTRLFTPESLKMELTNSKYRLPRELQDRVFAECKGYFAELGALAFDPNNQRWDYEVLILEKA